MQINCFKVTYTPVKLERENNFKEYKSAYDIDSLPKFGAGSEFGREQKEEARRRRYGIIRKKYNPNNQPWLMKIGTGKQAKKLKGVREGTVSENTSYYIFTQCPDGAFEAAPVEEWYNFTPVIKYKYLNSDEAEEEFSKRDRIMNYFNVMLKKRIKNDDKEVEMEEAEKIVQNKSKKKSKDFLLTDMDDWVALSDEDDEENEEEKEEKEDEESKGKKKKKKGGPDSVKKKKNAKSNSDDEAIEESDEGDFDDREVDYMTGSESSLSDLEDRDKADKYEEKGVDEERGLRKLIDSEEESEEETKENENEETAEEKPKEEGNASNSDSSNSSSDSESDIEKDESISSALFMQKKNGGDKKKGDKPSSRSATPNTLEKEDKLSARKRKLENDSGSAKRSRTESPVNSSQGFTSEGITEDAIRRYLTRKPMTTKDLLSKFKSKKISMSTEQMASTIAQLLKRISPETKYVNDVLYLSLKTPV
ncbi:general transcription factor IIF subunit 1-like isoform X2 [Liolophura sinensis]|uniref:general transcription factor IIF subunit 1-like isoform X2 n=1 Tax=Liolophura sinensis TaxID=3198878 RepID=UPI00315879DF